MKTTVELISENNNGKNIEIKLFEMYDKYFTIGPIKNSNNKGIQIMSLKTNSFANDIVKNKFYFNHF